jgi:hypothetical protein
MQVPEYVFEILIQDAWNLDPGEPLLNWSPITYPSADRTFLRKVVSDMYREVEFMLVCPEPELKPDEFEIWRPKSALNPFS